MAVRKEFRNLTVGDVYRNGKSVPMLRVSGLWLEELGFKTGNFVRIKCEDGQLIISLNEEKSQQVAEEKAFMEAAEEISEGKGRYSCQICGRARDGVLRMRKDILAKAEFIIIMLVLIIIVVFGKDIMAAINGTMEV